MREDILFIVHPGYNLSAHTSYLSQWEKEQDETIKKSKKYFLGDKYWNQSE